MTNSCKKKPEPTIVDSSQKCGGSSTGQKTFGRLNPPTIHFVGRTGQQLGAATWTDAIQMVCQLRSRSKRFHGLGITLSIYKPSPANRRDKAALVLVEPLAGRTGSAIDNEILIAADTETESKFAHRGQLLTSLGSPI